jgi:hypothetical protein
MNNRIKELMLEAGYAAPEIAPRAQRLAELLILEICETAAPYMSQSLATHIKDYFGVTG